MRTYESNPLEQSAIRKLTRFSLLAIVIAVLAFAELILSRYDSRWINVSLGYLSVLGLMTMALSAYASIQVRDAYATLASSDQSFKTPLRLCRSLATGFMLGIPAIIILFLAVELSASHRLDSPFIPAVLLAVLLGLGVVLSLLVGILLLRGLVGLLLGFWKLGNRYQSVAFKVAALVYPLPITNLFVSILLFFKFRRLRTRTIPS